MANLEIYQTSSLEKIMTTDANDFIQSDSLSALKGERISWQIALRADEIMSLRFSVTREFHGDLTIRRVGNVPVELASYDKDCDDDYISHSSGIYPDILFPVYNNIVNVKPKSFTVLWITVELPKDISAGDHIVTVDFTNDEKAISKKTEFCIHAAEAVIPKQHMKFTQWMHADCIADYYNYQVFSPEHWNMIGKFIKMAANIGANMMYTPIFTPPLDTRYGNERTTIQLIDVYKDADGYSFKFEKLKKWLNICRENGIHIFEFSHLFSQWGAKYTPKIVAYTEKGQESIFGWETSSSSEEYEIFLRQMLAALCAFIDGEEGEFYFHISDEPEKKDMQRYLNGYRIVKDCVKNHKIIDAFSEIELYDSNIMDIPVPNISCAEDFYKCGVSERWVYYSCANNKDVCNRYISMPSYRNRAIGLQFYKYQTDGFLHWGYNFYNSGLSDFKINPFSVTDAGGLMPAGDSFSVYPGTDGPIESIRSVVFYEALADLAACELLETFIGRDEVLKIIEKNEKITFKSYPKSTAALLEIRQCINEKIDQLTHNNNVYAKVYNQASECDFSVCGNV